MSSNAQAVAIRCPHCHQATIECVASEVWVRGFLIAYQIGRRPQIGCRSCVRGALLKQAGLSALIGWFSITALIINPFLVIYNFFRGLFVSANPEAVRKKLAEMGIDPNAEDVDVLQAAYALAVGMIAADGEIDESEVRVAAVLGERLFEGFDKMRLIELCRRHQTLPPAVDQAVLLADILEEDGKDVIYNFVFTIAQADGQIVPAEEALLGEIAAGLDLDLDAWRQRMAAKSAEA